jgi:hypothetical protein
LYLEFNTEGVSELDKLNGAKILGEHVSRIVVARNENDHNLVIFNAFAYVMIANVNVLCSALLN